MDSDFIGPVNIGSEEMVTINQLVDIAANVSNKTIEKKHIDGPLGVRGRNSNNDLIREKLDWDYSMSLEEGIRKTYSWIKRQITLLEIDEEIVSDIEDESIDESSKSKSFKLDFMSRFLKWMDE